MTPQDIQTIYDGFGAAIKRHRNTIDITQDELARRVGLSRASIANIENGRQKILLHQIYLFAKSLNLEPAELLVSADLSENVTPLPTNYKQEDLDFYKAVMKKVKEDE